MHRGRWRTAHGSTTCCWSTTSRGSRRWSSRSSPAFPYEWYTNNDIASYEGFYASVFYSYFAGLGLDVVVEDSSSHGRLDMALRFNDNVYLFEFKVVELAPEGAAGRAVESEGLRGQVPATAASRST